MDGILLTYDVMIFFSGNLSGFQIFSGFFRIFIKSSDFFTEWMVYFYYMIFWFSFFIKKLISLIVRRRSKRGSTVSLDSIVV